MEIRTLRRDEREALLDLLDGWELLDGWRGRDFFRRYIEDDPSYADENLWVAVDDGRILSSVQIFPRRVRVLGHAVPAGGIGGVYTEPGHRGQGLASRLLEAAIDDMASRGMQVSLLFAGREGVYGKLGWQRWTTERCVLRLAENAPPPSNGEESATSIEVAPFSRERDLAAVKAIHSAYSASRNGTVVRDDALWDASFVLAGNPKEEFLVARQDGATVAYLRSALLNGILTVTELARKEDAAVALALLMARTLEVRDDDPIAPPGLASRQLRSAALLPAFDDLSLTVALEHRGLSSHPFEDPTSMLRCLNMKTLAQQLDISLFPDEEPDEFLRRILPPDSLVFWPADRF